MGGDIMTDENDQPTLPERTQVCTCRGGDLLNNPQKHCPTCSGEETRRF